MVYTKNVLTGPRFDVGVHTYGKIEVVGSVGRIKIGKYCSIAFGVKAIMHGHNTNWITTYPFSAENIELKKKWPEGRSIGGHPLNMGNINIGNDVWIGNDVTLLGGITIGDGAVIGANSVVAKNVSSYSIIVGNPGTEVKKRFDQHTINCLQKIKWWDWSEHKIRKNLHLLCSSNLNEFVKKHMF